MKSRLVKALSLSVVLTGACALSTSVQGQAVTVGPAQIYSGFSTANTDTALIHYQQGLCNRPGQVFSYNVGTLYQGTGSFQTITVFCRENYSATAYHIYEHPFIINIQGGAPPNLQPKCVGPCWPTPSPVSMPVPPPYMPPPCITSDTDCPVDSSASHSTEVVKKPDATE